MSSLLFTQTLSLPLYTLQRVVVTYTDFVFDVLIHITIKYRHPLKKVQIKICLNNYKKPTKILHPLEK